MADKSKLAQQKQVTIGETTYTIQMVSASWYLDTVDECKDRNGNTQSGKYMETMLKNVIASPRVTMDDFTGRIYELRNLVRAAEKFILGEDIKVKGDAKNEIGPEDEE